MDDAWICFALRLRVARWMYVRIHPETMDMETIGVSEFLAFKERLATGGPDNQWMLDIVCLVCNLLSSIPRLDV